jgi:hypothetical protein
MTTDRTAAATRRHLLHTADERPADGQLEAILLLTSTTGQRSRWDIAARGLARPSAALPRAVLRFGLVAALVIVAVAGIAAFGGGSGGGTPFEGTWTSIDPADSSEQTLVIGPGPTPTVHFEDAFSIMCFQAGDATTLFVAEGPGEISANVLTAHFPESGCVTWRVPPSDGTFNFNPETDTLLDDYGIVWRRQP